MEFVKEFATFLCIKKALYKFGDFTLASGKHSSVLCGFKISSKLSSLEFRKMIKYLENQICGKY